MHTVKAVITGDLIGSSAKGAQAIEQAMQIIAQTARQLSYLNGVNTRFTRNRGDGWQIYLDFPGLCLCSVLAITTALRAAGVGLKTRQSIGIGTVDTLPPDNLSAAFGNAFEISGSNLDQMAKGETLCISGPHITPIHEALIALADWQSNRWSREQAEAVNLVLVNDELTTAELADRLGITRQAFQARLTSAGYAALEPALYAFQSQDWDGADHA